MNGADRLVTLVRRGPVLAALRAEALDRRDLEARLDVSKPTVLRATGTLADYGLVERVDGRFRLTAQGEVVAAALDRFERVERAATRLGPFLATTDYGVAVEHFADAEVTTRVPGDPYRPVRRFMSLVESTDRLRGFDVATIAPGNVETLYERIVDGMVTDVCYPESVVETIVESSPDRSADAASSGNLTLRVAEDLPCGLALFDERVALGGYDPETGALAAFVDTDDPDAYAWGEREFERFCADATVVVGDAP
ncbi:helix-turn-helix transcriptional regulator [Halomarina oriensis]|uniref:MarR family transcriptional regulator n=1 Tax=Halomarina oriensis TaxID=671145 RepID=A0A6B0GQ43_9EURY|nr:MarR family transcriptional regulator [Halomarina oriensis]MWG36972.1 MarR family transcriptional regulator [Halomarina oriensis]